MYAIRSYYAEVLLVPKRHDAAGQGESLDQPRRQAGGHGDAEGLLSVEGRYVIGFEGPDLAFATDRIASPMPWA